MTHIKMSNNVVADLQRIRALTTGELRDELRRNPATRHVLDQSPRLTKGALRSWYSTWLRTRSQDNNSSARIGREPVQTTQATPVQRRVEEEITPRSTVSTTLDTSNDSSDDEDYDDDEDTYESRECNLKTLLNGVINTSYITTILILVYDLFATHHADSGSELVPSSDSQVDQFHSSRACLLSVVIVGGTYMLIHNALALTRTQVYYVQVAASLFWGLFLLLLLTGSKPCLAVLQHVDYACVASGMTNDTAAVSKPLDDWVTQIRNFIIEPQPDDV